MTAIAEARFRNSLRLVMTVILVECGAPTEHRLRPIPRQRRTGAALYIYNARPNRGATTGTPVILEHD
jgi:hypothetical protein